MRAKDSSASGEFELSQYGQSAKNIQVTVQKRYE